MDERKCKRMPVGVGCWLVGRDDPCCLRTVDISDTGVSVITEDPLPVGQRVELQFFTPRSSKGVTLRAEVVWSRLDPEGAMGLRFLAPSDEGRRVLGEFARLLRERKPIP